MKKIILLFTSGYITLVLASFIVVSGSWNIDTNYTIKFSGKRAEGTFSGLKGTIIYDADNLANSKIDVTVDVNTVKTGNSLKNRHTKGNAWFDAEKYPVIRFTSSSFEKKNNETTVKGILEMHGIKKELVIPFTFQENNGKGLFKGQFKINRKDYGIEGTAMNSFVGDEFDVSIVLPVHNR